MFEEVVDDRCRSFPGSGLQAALIGLALQWSPSHREDTDTAGFHDHTGRDSWRDAYDMRRARYSSTSFSVASGVIGMLDSIMSFMPKDESKLGTGQLHRL